MNDANILPKPTFIATRSLCSSAPILKSKDACLQAKTSPRCIERKSCQESCARPYRNQMLPAQKYDTLVRRTFIVTSLAPLEIPPSTCLTYVLDLRRQFLSNVDAQSNL